MKVLVACEEGDDNETKRYNDYLKEYKRYRLSLLKSSLKEEITLKKEEYVAFHFLKENHICPSDEKNFQELITKALLQYKGLERTLFRQDIEITFGIVIHISTLEGL